MKKRILLTFAALLVVATVTLAFTPHYGCACGENEKVNGSQLEYLPQTIVEFVVNTVKAIFK
ncbi:MAG: hypothetical protein ABL984_14320 [Pyrinomonadaceae bacterium]